MRLLTTFILLMVCLTARGQISPTRNWVDSEVTYTDSAGKAVTVHSSLPKGGGQYTDSSGKTYSYVIFWTRVINESANPLELTIKFPADSFAISPLPNSYLRIFLPPDKMTPDNIQQGDYGLTNLRPFLDAGFSKPSILQRTINPKEEYFFYTAVLIYQARGTARARLVLQAHNLFYSISIDPHSSLIPCGQLVFKN